VSASPDNELQDETAAVIAAARAGEPDRYLSALLAPPAQRPALLALAAFSAEIRRIPLLARDPHMAGIRAQWWRDALTLPAALRTGYPVADAVRAVARTLQLPADLLEQVIDGAEADAGPADAQAWLATRVSRPEGALFALAARTLGVPAGPEASAACAAAGHAYGAARLLLELPVQFEHGPGPSAAALLAVLGVQEGALPTDEAEERIAEPLRVHVAQIRRSLAVVRPFASGLPRPKRTAFLPLALVETYLRAVEKAGRRFLRVGVSIGPLARVSRIAAAHWSGRV
jgi:phytoene synthase